MRIRHDLCYTNCGALAGTTNSSMGTPSASVFTLTVAISRSTQCSTTGVTKAVVCVILSVDDAYKRIFAANRKE